MANQKIVLCFEHDEIQGKVKKELVSQKRKNIEIEKCTSKVSVYDVLKQDDVIGLLMTLSCGVETWSLEEIAKIKDSCTKNIVLILQDDMYTTENLTFLYENHVYSCVKAGNKGVNIREVVKLLYQERTPKDARTEYGLSTLSDVNHTDSMEKRYEEKANALVNHLSTLSDNIKSAEARIAEIIVLKKHIINYSKTRDIYVEYRKAGYSKKFFEEHREAITIHKAAKQAFDELGLKRIPRVKDLNEEYYKLMAEKKKMSSEYYESRTAMQELLKAQKNVEMFLEAEQKQNEKEKTKEQDR